MDNWQWLEYADKALSDLVLSIIFIQRTDIKVALIMNGHASYCFCRDKCHLIINDHVFIVSWYKGYYIMNDYAC